MNDDADPAAPKRPMMLPASLRTQSPQIEPQVVEPAEAPITPPPMKAGSKDRQISPVAWALLAAFAAAGTALLLIAQPPRVLTFIFVLLGWLLSLIAHEFGHAFVAYRGGDWTVPSRGYLTLDPRRYLNNLTTLLLPLIALVMGGIALPGGAVLLRLDLIRSKGWRSATALAGPMATLVTFLLLMAAVAALNLSQQQSDLSAALSFLAFLQATALILNLLPVPGLDGYRALEPFLPARIVRSLRPVEGVAIIGLLVIVLWIPEVSDSLFRFALQLFRALGGSVQDFVAGYDSFRFWTAPGR